MVPCAPVDSCGIHRDFVPKPQPRVSSDAGRVTSVRMCDSFAWPGVANVLGCVANGPIDLRRRPEFGLCHGIDVTWAAIG